MEASAAVMCRVLLMELCLSMMPQLSVTVLCLMSPGCARCSSGPLTWPPLTFRSAAGYASVLLSLGTSVSVSSSALVEEWDIVPWASIIDPVHCTRTLASVNEWFNSVAETWRSLIFICGPEKHWDVIDGALHAAADSQSEKLLGVSETADDAHKLADV